ncbi:MAG TPA: hypothetical protein VFJ97_02190 [Dermatophilaceae bacterium]|nr:hypothetical protein [Dermatophilaceae bacterium]
MRRTPGTAQSLHPRRRDRYRTLVTAMTGLTAAASVAAVGLASGVAARATEQEQAAKADRDARRSAQTAAWRQAYADYQAAVAARQGSAAQPVILLRARPSRTIVTTRVVYAVARPGVAAAGGGSARVVRSAGSGPAVRAAAAPAPAGRRAPAPPPPPPPLPSSGS